MLVLLALAFAGAGDASLVTGSVEVVAEGHQFTEGPVWLPTDKLAFSDIPANAIFLADGSVWRKPSGNTNGMTLDNNGNVVCCEHGTRSLTRVAPDGTVTVLADTYDGKKFNSPNDAVVHSDGAIFFTDPPYGLGNREKELSFNGVFQRSPDGTIQLVADDFNRPNGIGLSPDESRLYVADSQEGHIREFKLRGGKKPEDLGVLCELPGPDGMAIDEKGNIWCTSLEGVVVFSPKGERLERVEFPQIPANCVFGGADRKTLYVTARTAVYQIRTVIAGVD